MKTLALMLFVIFFNYPLLAKSATSASIFGKQLFFTDENGKAVNLDEFKGKRSVFAFAYTSCRITCPLVMRELKKIDALLGEHHQKAEIFFVTIDPRVDTPTKLAAYKKDWGVTSSNWHFLSGKEKDIQSLADTLGFGFSNTDDHIFHDKKILDVGPDGLIQNTLESFGSDLNAIF